MKKIRGAAVGLILCLVSVHIIGCGDKFWDPTQVGRFKPVPAVNVILDSLGVAEETPSAWETGEEPRPVDVVAYKMDYVIGPGDNVTISIFELLSAGGMYTNEFVVTETGKISIPEVGVVEAAGLTEAQLEEEIREILSPNILKEPTVKVALAGSQSRVYSILGSGVPRPGRYGIPRYDYRLTDALAMAGGISQFNTSYIYVSRPITGEEPMAEQAVPAEPAKPAVIQPTEAEPTVKPEQEMMEIIAPLAKNRALVSGQVVMTSTELASEGELSQMALPEELWQGDVGGKRADLESLLAKPTESETVEVPAKAGGGSTGAGRIEWVFKDGKWVPVRIEAGPGAMPQPATERVAGAPKEKAPSLVGWEEIGPGGAQRRVIKIPADRLLSGDPRYNIVIRPSDSVHVPIDIIGEFCIMGNVNRQGFVNITGRPMTLKMAIAAAGGLGPLAWPKSCEVVRRIGKKREEVVMVDLDKIALGEQPDFFIKPNDLINVGTHPTARWRAVLRNAFRASYGFAFVYDRNFADRDYGTGRPFDWLF